MEKVQTLVIILLILAIIFSIVSIVLTVSITNLKPINFNKNLESKSSDGANIKLYIEPPPREVNKT